MNPNQTTVWAALAISQAVQYGIPYINASDYQPTLDQSNFSYTPGTANMGGGGLHLDVSGDFTGTDPINSGGQVDSYIPTTLQVPGTLGGVPGHSASSSRGTRNIPAVIQGTDLLGEFSGYGLISVAGVLSYQKLSGVSHYASGADVNYPGGEMRWGTRANSAGVFTEWFKLTNVGNFEPVTTGVGRLGSAAKGFGALTLDYTNSATVGAVAINKPAGSGNIGVGTASIVVTNSLVTANSLVLAWLMFTDATLTFIKSVIPANGSFTITGNANATANTKVGFLVINTDS